MNNFFGTPLIASEHGAEVDRLMWLIHGLMAVLFIGWLVYYIYVLVRFRESKNPVANYKGVKSHISSYLEAFVAMTEGVLLVGFAIPIWASWAGDYPEQKDAIEIRLAGQQFAWNARYSGPDGVFGKQKMELAEVGNPLGYDPEDPDGKDDVDIVNDLYVPVNKPIVVYVSSMDVIHSFAVRSLRVCQDATPGMSVPVSFTATEKGIYRITCAQLCGNLHFSMGGRLHVVSQEEYDAWLVEEAESASGGGLLDFGGFDDAFGGDGDADDAWGSDSAPDDSSAPADDAFGSDDAGFGGGDDAGFGGGGDDDGWGDEAGSDEAPAEEAVEDSATEASAEEVTKPAAEAAADDGWDDDSWGDF